MRLTTGRRLESFNTGVQTNAFSSPLHRGESLDLCPEDAARARRGRGRGRADRVASRRDRGAGPPDDGAPRRAGLHDVPLPGRGRHEPDHERGLRPEVGHRRSSRPRRSGSRSSRSAREGSLPAVDLHLMTAEPTAEERAAVDAVLGAPTTGWDGGERTERDLRVARGARGSARTSLLPVLHALQARVGWISEGGLNYACERLSVPPAEAYGVATFYAMFSVEPQPATVLHVCDDLACRIRGGDAMAERSRRRMRRRPRGGPEPLSRPVRGGAGGVVPGGGCGSHVPRRGAGRRRPDPRDDPRHGGARAAARAGAAPRRRAAAAACRASVDPTSLHDYRAHGGYAALARAIELGPDAVIQQVTDAKLLGRGGAAFPTGVKWRAVADQPGTPEVRRLQRGRIRARHVQGPRAHGERSRSR